MQIPSNMILTKVRPSLYMPFWVCVWSCISAATAGTTSFGGLVAVRFCLGIAEAPFFPGMIFLTGRCRRASRNRSSTCMILTLWHRCILHAFVLVHQERACFENCDPVLGSCTRDCVLWIVGGWYLCWLGWSKVSPKIVDVGVMAESLL